MDYEINIVSVEMQKMSECHFVQIIRVSSLLCIRINAFRLLLIFLCFEIIALSSGFAEFMPI